jgi:hypothetical protein
MRWDTISWMRRGRAPNNTSPQRRLFYCARPLLAAAVGRDLKSKISPVFYIIAIPSAFIHQWIAGALYVIVALIQGWPGLAFSHLCEEHMAPPTPRSATSGRAVPFYYRSRQS